jgi:glucokinase
VRDLVGALEIGGTHVTAACVDITARAVLTGTMRRLEFAPSAPREALLAAIHEAARAAARRDIRGWGVAVPGPFDYERGICTIEGVAKLDALHGVDLKAELAGALRVDTLAFSFLNDADAFLLGEWWAGAARGHRAAMGVTLGTGLGSAFLRDDKLLSAGAGVPPDARLDLIPYRDAPVEDVISARGVTAAYRGSGGEGAVDVAEIAARARRDDPAARAVFRAFGSALGEFLAPHVAAFEPTALVFGGGVARSWPLFSDDFRAACPPAGAIAFCGVAAHPSDAPLVGAACYVARGGGRQTYRQNAG